MFCFFLFSVIVIARSKATWQSLRVLKGKLSIAAYGVSPPKPLSTTWKMNVCNTVVRSVQCQEFFNDTNLGAAMFIWGFFV